LVLSGLLKNDVFPGHLSKNSDFSIKTVIKKMMTIL
jgi:hypothetical protein